MLNLRNKLEATQPATSHDAAAVEKLKSEHATEIGFLKSHIRELEDRNSVVKAQMDCQAATVDELSKMTRTQLEYISQLQQELKFADEKIVKLHPSSEALERMIGHQRHPMCVEGLGYDAARDYGGASWEWKVDSG